jgi:hypothetical protein
MTQSSSGNCDATAGSGVDARDPDTVGSDSGASFVGSVVELAGEVFPAFAFGASESALRDLDGLPLPPFEFPGPRAAAMEAGGRAEVKKRPPPLPE